MRFKEVNRPRNFYTFQTKKEMATHSSVLAWRIPGMGEPGGLPSMGSHRVGHDWRDLAAAAAVDKEALHWWRIDKWFGLRIVTWWRGNKLCLDSLLGPKFPVSGDNSVSFPPSTGEAPFKGRFISCFQGRRVRSERPSSFYFSNSFILKDKVLSMC